MSLTISIPSPLIKPLCAANFGTRNAVCTLLILKSIDNSGTHAMYVSKKRGCLTSKISFKLNEKQRLELSEIQGLSLKQIDNHINALIKLGLATRKGLQLFVASYAELCERFGATKSASVLRVAATNRKLIYIIEKIGIENEVKRQKEAFKKNLNWIARAYGDKRLVEESKKRGSASLWDWQKQILASGLRLDELPDIEYVLMQYRADWNVSYKGLRFLFGYSEKTRGGIAQLKRRLMRHYLLNFTHEELIMNSANYTTRGERANGLASKFGKVYYRQGQMKGEISLILPDNATFYNHNEPIPEEVLQFSEALKILKQKNESAPL